MSSSSDHPAGGDALSRRRFVQGLALGAGVGAASRGGVSSPPQAARASVHAAASRAVRGRRIMGFFSARADHDPRAIRSSA